MKNKIFSQRLKSARKMAGLSMDELVKKIDNAVSKNSISKYEKAEMIPDSRILIKLANALSVKVDYFFRNVEVQLNAVEYRKKKTKLLIKAQESIEENVKDFVERITELELLLGIKKNFLNPLTENSIKNLDDLEKVAIELRDVWELGNDPISNVVDLLEDKGIKLIELDQDESFDGLSARVNGTYVIAYNKNFDSVRKRFTVLHELAHLILDFDVDVEESHKEKLCHNFASAFLMHKETFLKEFGQKRTKFTLEELIQLKSYFGASIQAIVYRAFNLGLLSESHKNQFFKAWGKLGYRKDEPGEYLSNEVPHRFEQLLRRAVAEDIISVNKASVLANLDVKELLNNIQIVK